MSASTQLLDQRLKEFRGRYYRDRIIRGSLILALLVSSMLFVALLSEGIFGFNTGVRTLMVSLLGITFLGVLGYMVLWPVAQLYSLSKGLTEMQIAELVKDRFPGINDKLINLLQLRLQRTEPGTLLDAAIEQKAAEVAPVEIASAINLKVNRKYIWFLLIPIGLFLITNMVRPGLIGAGSHRLLNFNKAFLPPAPFALDMGDLPAKMIAGESLPLTVKVSGNELPAELSVFIRKSGQSEYVNYLLAQDKPGEFSYTIENVKEDFSMYVGNPEVKSAEHAIQVFRRPFIKEFQAIIEYPAYTNQSPEIVPANIGDLKVLRGSVIRWKLEPVGDTKSAWLIAKDSLKFKPANDGKLQATRRVMGDIDYYIGLQSSFGIPNQDTVHYRVTALADRFPTIYLLSPNPEFKVDLEPRLPLELEIGDDYGFTRMSLHYRFTKSGGESAVSKDYTEYDLSLNPRLLLQPLSYGLDLTELGMKEGDELEYFIKVWDNDGIVGPKSSTSGVFKVIYPTLDARYDEAQQAQDDAKEQIEALKKQAESLKQSYEKMQEKLLNQKKLSFDDRREVQRMVDEHQKMQDNLEKAQEKMEEARKQMEENSMVSEQTMEKMEQLSEFLEELKDPEIEKLLEEIEKKLENVNTEQLREQMEELKMNEDQLKKNLERSLELLKQLEVDQKIDELRNKIDNLQDKQENLRQQLDKPMTPEDLKNLGDRQEDLSKQMDEIKKDMDKLGDLKEETKTPDAPKMDDLKEKADEAQDKMDGASEDMKESSEQQQEGSKSGQKQSQQSKQSAGQKQEDAADKLQEMSESLANMQMNQQMQQDQENMENLRALLENLLKLSFDQEDLKEEVKGLSYSDPALKEKSQQQKKLQDDMSMVRDSLESLANRVFQIQKFVLDESQKITQSMQESQNFFRNKQVPQVNFHQQIAMTSINNLANMLSDVMKQLQQSMQNNKQGQAMCPKPGSASKPNMQGVSQQQTELNKKMQEMMKGEKPGQKPGDIPGDQLQQMAGEQKSIRDQLEKVQEQVKKEGGKPLGDLDKIMQDMIQSETELQNKRFTEETFNRQQEILSRLLQADKSIREREMDDARESKTAQRLDQKSPSELTPEEYKTRIRQELLKSNQLEYSSDFIILIEQYFKKLEGAK